MSEKSDLQRTISGCRYMISQIQADIQGMRDEQTNFRGYAQVFANNKNNVSDYDMTVGDTWRRNLCETAQAKQTALATAIGNAVSACNTVKSDLENCISKANQMITDYQNKIAACEARIAEIEAEEAAAAAAAQSQSQGTK